VARYFFYGFENFFLNKFILSKDNQKEHNIMPSKIDFNIEILLSVMQKLALKRISSKLAYQRINTTLKDMRFFD